MSGLRKNGRQWCFWWKFCKDSFSKASSSHILGWCWWWWWWWSGVGMSFITSFKGIVYLPRFHWFNQSFLWIVRRARIPTGFGVLYFGRFVVVLGTMLVHRSLSLPPPNATPQEITLFQGVITLPETKSSHLKMDGWNTIVSFWAPAYFLVANC